MGSEMSRWDWNLKFRGEAHSVSPEILAGIKFQIYQDTNCAGKRVEPEGLKCLV